MDEGNIRIPFRRTLETFVAPKSTTFLSKRRASVFRADQRSDTFSSDTFDPERIIMISTYRSER
jgi:hypothetical protein